MAYDNEMTGALFQNDKGDNPKRPDHRGDVTIGGVKYSLSAWNTTAKNTGKPFISLKVSEYVERQPQQQQQQQQPAQQTLVDEIPF
jgi:uncharacterized protein (DUF736 family)